MQEHMLLHTSRIDTVISPDDGHIFARNMWRKEINILRKTVHQVGFIYKVTQSDASEYRSSLGQSQCVTSGTSVLHTQSYASVDITCNYVLVMIVCTVADHLNKNGSDSEPLPVTQARVMYKSCMDTGE